MMPQMTPEKANNLFNSLGFTIPPTFKSLCAQRNTCSGGLLWSFFEEYLKLSSEKIDKIFSISFREENGHIFSGCTIKYDDIILGEATGSIKLRAVRADTNQEEDPPSQWVPNVSAKKLLLHSTSSLYFTPPKKKQGLDAFYPAKEAAAEKALSVLRQDARYDRFFSIYIPDSFYQNPFFSLSKLIETFSTFRLTDDNFYVATSTSESLIEGKWILNEIPFEDTFASESIQDKNDTNKTRPKLIETCSLKFLILINAAQECLFSVREKQVFNTVESEVTHFLSGVRVLGGIVAEYVGIDVVLPQTFFGKPASKIPDEKEITQAPEKQIPTLTQ